MDKDNLSNNVYNLKLTGSAVISKPKKNISFSKLQKQQRYETKSVDITQNNASNFIPKSITSAKYPSKEGFPNTYSKTRLNSSLNKAEIYNKHKSFSPKKRDSFSKDTKFVKKSEIASLTSFVKSKDNHKIDSLKSGKTINHSKVQQNLLYEPEIKDENLYSIANNNNQIDSLNEEAKDFDFRSKIMKSKLLVMDGNILNDRNDKFNEKSLLKSSSCTSNPEKSTASKSEAARKIQRWYRSKIKYGPKHMKKIQSEKEFFENSEKNKNTRNIFSSKDKSPLSSYRSEISENIASYQDEYYDSFINEKFIESNRDKIKSKIHKAVPEKPAKYSWLEEIENEMLAHTREECENVDGNTKLDKNPYMTDEKYEHVLSYLEGLKQEDKTLQKRDKTTNKVTPKNHASSHLNLKDLDMIVNKKASGDNNQDNDDEKKRLLEENKNLKDKISKHLSFIDQLIEDKKELGESLEKFQKQCKTMTQHYQNELKTREERHVIELKKLKDINLAAEQLKREQWIKAEANKIKELTAKGFEPTLQKLIIQHQKEVLALKNLHKEEIDRLREKEKQKYDGNIEEAKWNFEEEIKRVRIIEKENAQKEFEKKLENEKEELRKEREDLWKEVEKEKNEAVKMVKRQEEESQKGQENLKNVHEMAIGALKREFETARKQQKTRHIEELEKVKREHMEEQQDWEKRFFKSHENELLEKEKELREKIRKERDRDIEKILLKLESEKEEELEKQKLFTEDQIRKLENKHTTEIQQIEKSEKSLSEKVSKLKAHIFKSETIKENLKAKLSQNKTLIEGLSKKLGQHQKERNSLKDIVRQEVADKMAAFESENVKLKQEVCDLKAKQKMEIREIKEIAEKQIRVKDEEINEIQNRVKEVIARRNKVEEDLRKEKAAAIKRADYIQEQLLDMKNQPAKKKPTA